MASTSFPEWLLWAKKLRDEHAHLKERLSALEVECERLRLTEEKPQAPASNDETPSSEAETQLQTIQESELEDATTVGDDFEPTSAQPADETADPPVDGLNDEEFIGSLLFVQGERSLQEYLDDAHEIFTAREEAFVKSFLSGLRTAFERATFENMLPEESSSQTWQTLFAAINKYIHDKERRRRNRRHLPV